MKKILAAMILTAFAAGVTASAAMPFGDRGPGPVPRGPAPPSIRKKTRGSLRDRRKRSRKKTMTAEMTEEMNAGMRGEMNAGTTEETSTKRRRTCRSPIPAVMTAAARRRPRRETAMTKTITTRTMADSSGKFSNRSKTDRREGPSSEGLFVCRNLDIHITRFI